MYISGECSTPSASLQRLWMTWVQVCDLGAISPASKGNLAPRDRAEIAYLHPEHLEALQSGGGRKAHIGDSHNARNGYEVAS